MTRSSLPLAKWPKADQAMWAALIAEGGILDEAGVGAHWREPTREILLRNYGCWLSYLLEAGQNLDAQHPGDRVDAPVLRSYVLFLSDLAPSSRANYVRALSVLLPRAYPAKEWGWLRALQRRLNFEERIARRGAKHGRIVATHKLFETGILVLESARLLTCQRQRAIRFRDGFAIAFLSARPLRCNNFVNLRLGHHLKKTPTGYRIEIAGEETKSGAPIEQPMPEDLVNLLEEYLEFHRPVLLKGRTDDHLWVGQGGRPFRPKHFSMRISKVTERSLGIAISPHLFRDSLATTVAIADPDHVRIIPLMLGHSTPLTGEEYYNQARTIEAGRLNQANIRQLRQRARLKRNRPTEKGFGRCGP